MKKILVLVCLFVSTLCASAINISLSEGDFGMDANVTKEGNNVRMQYKINGMNALPSDAQVSDEQRAALSQIGDVNFDILASCSAPKIKVISMEIYDLTGKLLSTISDTEWVTIEKQEDIAKLKELCGRI